VALDPEDFTFLPDGTGRVLIRRSKTDQAGEGNTAYLARETVLSQRLNVRCGQRGSLHLA
jgi:hypothetical protein